MTEQFANQQSPLVLAAPCGMGDATVVLAGGYAGLPSTGTFRLLIDSEIMIATARTGPTVTVTRAQEATSAASHAVNALVYQSLTAGALAQFEADIIAAIPAGPTGAGPSGSLGVAPASGTLHLAGDQFAYNLPCATANRGYRFRVTASARCTAAQGGLAVGDDWSQVMVVAAKNISGVVTITAVAYPDGDPLGAPAMGAVGQLALSVQDAPSGTNVVAVVDGNGNNDTHPINVTVAADYWVGP